MQATKEDIQNLTELLLIHADDFINRNSKMLNTLEVCFHLLILNSPLANLSNRMFEFGINSVLGMTLR